MPKIREGHTVVDTQEHFRRVCIDKGLCAYCNAAQWGLLCDFLVDSSVDGREFARLVWLVSPDKSWEYVYTTLKAHKLV